MSFINHCESARHHLVCLWYIPKYLIQYYSTLYSLGKKMTQMANDLKFG